MNRSRAVWRRCAAGALCFTLLATMPLLASCTPELAVGDTQSGTAGRHDTHDGVDRVDARITVIGSDDARADTRLLDAYHAAGLPATYLSTRVNDAALAGQQAVEDSADQVVNVIVVNRLDGAGQDRAAWDAALRYARQTGVPVILADPVWIPDDSRLYAAIFRTAAAHDDDADETRPLDTATLAVIDDTAHGKVITVTMSAAVK